MAEQASTRKLKYIPAFDGIRGVFCIIIISHHLPVLFFRVPFAFGWEILQLFFVMSGYLITMILVNDKKYAFKEFASRFYTKRIYRIFPLYFFFIFLMLLLGFATKDSAIWNEKAKIWPELSQNWGYLFSYTYNLKEWFNFKHGLPYNISPVFAHLWSLSLEEQFYIFYPIIVYFLSVKNLKRFLVAVVVLSPIIRLLGYNYMNVHVPETLSTIPDFNKKELISWILHRNTLFQLDALSLGGCLALFDFSWIKKPVRVFWGIFVVFLAVVLFNGWSDVQNGIKPNLYEALLEHTVLVSNHQYLYMYTLVNVLMAALIIVTFRENNPFKIFEHKFFIRMGQISYGLYVYHYIVLVLYLAIWVFGPKIILHKNLINRVYGNVLWEIVFVVGFYIILILISELSFRYFETYFLQLKAKIDKAKRS
ncbi:MAG: acyltransferase [Chitinophagales bacterium]|nr:acyltransferase [Chitinophagales bacterium]